MISSIPYLSNLVSLSALFFVACASPGPDFINIVSHALANRQSGCLTALGAAVGCITWASVAMFGMSLLLARFSFMFEALKVPGAAYLVYIGARMLWSAKQTDRALSFHALSAGAWHAFRRGLLTSLGNPKSAVFFGSLLMSVVPSSAPTNFHVLAVSIIGVVATGWYVTVAFFFSTPAVREVYGRIRRVVDGSLGVFFILIGVSLGLRR